jgi:hypothetical protein
MSMISGAVPATVARAMKQAAKTDLSVRDVIVKSEGTAIPIVNGYSIAE